MYEPGSTFKLVTYSAALDGAGVEPTDMVDCQGGAMTMYGRTLHDDKSRPLWRDHGAAGAGALERRGRGEDGAEAGAGEVLRVHARALGLATAAGIELPSETRGLLQPPQKWGSTSILSMAIGQEIGVTPVQLVTMVSTIANGGVYLPPHVLLQSTDADEGRSAAAAGGVSSGACSCRRRCRMERIA